MRNVTINRPITPNDGNSAKRRTHLEMEGVDTIGGYVYGMLGRIPRIGDAVDAGEARIEVIAAIGRRLRKLRVSPVPKVDGEKKS